MEVCVESISSAKAASRGGASRIELCSNLLEGGTTPSIGLLRIVKKSLPAGFPVFVMIRPRGGDFLYTEDEVEVMIEDIRLLKDSGADGFVFGALRPDGTVDVDTCNKLLEQSKPLPATFHRAIDMTEDILAALDTVVALGFERVLTSGGSSCALQGLTTLQRMIKRAGDQIIIMPGGGITEDNLSHILTESVAKEFHGSARTTTDSDMKYRKSSVIMGATLTTTEFSIKVTDSEKVRKMVSYAKELIKLNS